VQELRDLSPWQRFRTAVEHPIDTLRQRRAKGLEISTSQRRVCRGDHVEVLVTIADTAGIGNVDIGLVCTEYYDEKVQDDESETRFGTKRQTSEAIAHAEWLRIDSAPGVQSVRLEVPAEAPFSYEGDCLSFRWEIIAHGRRRRRLDAQARLRIAVAP
jgi:hypothetical protein